MYMYFTTFLIFSIKNLRVSSISPEIISYITVETSNSNVSPASGCLSWGPRGVFYKLLQLPPCSPLHFQFLPQPSHPPSSQMCLYRNYFSSCHSLFKVTDSFKVRQAQIQVWLARTFLHLSFSQHCHFSLQRAIPRAPTYTGLAASALDAD